MLRSFERIKTVTFESCNDPAKNQDAIHEEVNKAKAKTPTGYTGPLSVTRKSPFVSVVVQKVDGLGRPKETWNGYRREACRYAFMLWTGMRLR
jgi:hypothetical protein